LIQLVVKHNTLLLESTGGSLVLALEATLFSVELDVLHFTNVLYNLLDNAVKYNHRAPEITLSTRNTAYALEIIIKDNGIGIPRDQQKKVFEKFYRVPTGNVHDVKGFGLGLNYVKLIVEKHNGTIVLESVPGKGSTFIITLPLNS
jgi:two-component system phosphate regulon sensor histidine kinase PhoR